MVTTVVETDLKELKRAGKGKVRDLYDLGEHLLIVATDRISAFDFILPTPIPDKGKVLTQMSCFWFGWSKKLIPNHLVSADVDQYPEEIRMYRETLEGRSMLVRKAKKIPVECVVRGYLAGSAWKEYRSSGMVCGMKLPPGLGEAQRLPQPIFTPTTKAEMGVHDANLSWNELVERVGVDLAQRLRSLSIKVFCEASLYAEARGLILADTKFEFGWLGGELILIDEMLTPDSSRFWEKSSYQLGRTPVQFDKQHVRDYLESIGWSKTPPVPALPQEVVLKTSRIYWEAYRRLTQ
ncbi:MAG: phosphoribosylaminoimidazolesuccinocarboxamide synthase [Elusimicrobia bacterium]|nr:phosphoribosylaminoimidazolesuccinocarboxamide synthase [Elusimicrobiota bacterium]